jgi:hypothetical protein
MNGRSASSLGQARGSMSLLTPLGTAFFEPFGYELRELFYCGQSREPGHSLLRHWIGMV